MFSTVLRLGPRGGLLETISSICTISLSAPCPRPCEGLRRSRLTQQSASSFQHVETGRGGNGVDLSPRAAKGCWHHSSRKRSSEQCPQRSPDGRPVTHPPGVQPPELGEGGCFKPAEGGTRLSEAQGRKAAPKEIKHPPEVHRLQTSLEKYHRQGPPNCW